MKVTNSFLAAVIAVAALNLDAVPPPAPVPAPPATAAVTPNATATATVPSGSVIFNTMTSATTPAYNLYNYSYVPPVGGSMIPGSVGGQVFPGTSPGGQLFPGTIGGSMVSMSIPGGTPTLPSLGLNSQTILPNTTYPNTVIIRGANGTTTTTPPGGIVTGIPAAGTSQVIVTGGATPTTGPGGTLTVTPSASSGSAVIVTGGSSTSASSAPGGTLGTNAVGGTAPIPQH